MMTEERKRKKEGNVRKKIKQNKRKVCIVLGCIAVCVVAICIWKQSTTSVQRDENSNQMENISIDSTSVDEGIIEAVLSGQEIPMKSEWEQILAKDATEITDEEYVQLAAVLICEMDEEIFEQMVEQCFDVTEQNYLIIKKQEYRPTEKYDKRFVE